MSAVTVGMLTALAVIALGTCIELEEKRECQARTCTAGQPVYFNRGGQCICAEVPK